MAKTNNALFFKKMEQILLIDSKKLKQILTVSILEFEEKVLANTKEIKKLTPYFQVESIFDKLLIQKLQPYQTKTNIPFLVNVEKRLDKKFLIKEISTSILEVYKNHKQVFLEEILKQQVEILVPKVTLKQKFHKIWDQQLIKFIQSSNLKNRELTINYWWHYFTLLFNTQTYRTYQLKQKSDVLTDTFVKFLAWVENPEVTIKENSDAIFRTILNWKISDAKKSEKQLKNKPNESFEVAYQALMGKLEANTNEYLEVLPIALSKLDLEDYNYLRQYYWEDNTMEAIGILKKTSKQTIDYRMQRARKKLKNFLEKLIT